MIVRSAGGFSPARCSASASCLVPMKYWNSPPSTCVRIGHEHDVVDAQRVDVPFVDVLAELQRIVVEMPQLVRDRVRRHRRAADLRDPARHLGRPAEIAQEPRLVGAAAHHAGDALDAADVRREAARHLQEAGHPFVAQDPEAGGDAKVGRAGRDLVRRIAQVAQRDDPVGALEGKVARRVEHRLALQGGKAVRRNTREIQRLAKNYRGPPPTQSADAR